VAANTNITTSELDFSNIKTNFKNFLRGQTELSDYNFEGSALSTLIDILAYNTHYSALYTNLAVNESFLDSAVKRDSVVSRASELGYLPRSARAATATLNIKASNVFGNPNILILPAYTSFTTNVGTYTYTFYNMEPYTAVNIANVYSFNNVVITEGSPLTQSYTVSDGMRYIISNKNCDISTLLVNVFESSSSSNKTRFNIASDILDVKNNDNVYFIREINNGQYEVQFGNNRIGKALNNGNIVSLSYFSTNMNFANGARLFSMDSIFGPNTVLSTVIISNGGSPAELLDDIKFNAPRFYSAGNRAVTSEDYKAVLIGDFSNIYSIQVWGGEENIPPAYGEVFISIAPKYNSILTVAEKTKITTEVLKSKKMVTITPKFINPSYLNINFHTVVYFNPHTTTKTANEINLLVKAVILNYDHTDMRRFDSVFRFSKLSTLIDSIDPSITSNISIFTITRILEVDFNILTNYNFHIDNPIYSSGVYEDSVHSNGFYVLGDTNINYIQDDGNGVLQRYYLDKNNIKIIINSNQGKVDYKSGSIYINNMQITRLSDTNLEFIFKMQSNDVISIRSNIININPFTLYVDVIPISNVTDSSYIFSPSR
jgi:hypothetical protein